jgi:hypothetical protein
MRKRAKALVNVDSTVNGGTLRFRDELKEKR